MGTTNQDINDAHQQDITPNDVKTTEVEYIEHVPGMAVGPAEATRKQRWLSYIWDSLDKTPEERKLLFKIDYALLTLGCYSYFVKYLDQINVNNAYVSGMREDLHMFGNELNVMQTLWGVGYLLGGLPSNIILTRVRPSYFLPAIELIWGGLTLALAGCKTPQQMYAVRFLVGLFESALYPGMIYILGSWYRSDELAKRICIFQMTSALGTMFSGYLMAAVIGLNGRAGLTGWQWLFIFDGLITVPVAVLSFFFLPDMPHNTRARYLTPEEISLTKVRMQLEGRGARQPYTWPKVRRIMTSWHWWVLVPLYVCWNNGSSGAQPVWAQYLKIEKAGQYSLQQINILPTITPGIQVFFTLVFAWTSDSFLRGRRWPSVLIGAVTNIICYASLWYWDISDGWRWFCYSASGIGSAVAGLIMSWANEICEADDEERAIVTGSMNQMAYLFQMWLPLVAWPALTAPRYTKGFSAATILNIFLIVFTLIAMYFAGIGGRKILATTRVTGTVVEAKV